MKKTTTTTLSCDKCKKNEVQIYNDCCNCCIPCNAMGYLRLGSKVVITTHNTLVSFQKCLSPYRWHIPDTL